MKIAIPTNDQKTISSHFGRAAGFMIITVEEGKVKEQNYVENNATGHAQGLHKSEFSMIVNGEHHHHDHARGEGEHSHENIFKAIGDCNLVIARGMGRRLMVDFQLKNAKVILTKESQISTAVQAYLEGNLVSDGEVCSHHH
ncbi:hypothetical protein EYV94_21225 [Puteibacter caeruleilacunae]|nr:hypothetical protein EYV94_21225 [Puteibacter caeruleilacunae]